MLHEPGCKKPAKDRNNGTPGRLIATHGAVSHSLETECMIRYQRTSSATRLVNTMIANLVLKVFILIILTKLRKKRHAQCRQRPKTEPRPRKPRPHLQLEYSNLTLPSNRPGTVTALHIRASRKTPIAKANGPTSASRWQATRIDREQVTSVNR